MLMLALACPVSAETRSTTDAGGVGLLQMPSARFGEDGYVGLGVSRQLPYDNFHITLQSLPWLEAVFHYTDIRNRLYSNIPEFSGDQTNKDRGFDLKLRLWEESAGFPQVSLGLRDFAGTGLFSGEYLVASRRYYDLDFSLGLGWGRTGARGGIRNPLRIFSSGFSERGNTGVSGGTPQTNRWFRGEQVALFGGVEWVTPVRGLTVKLEYDGNDYQSEPLSNNQAVDSPVNAGINYKLWNSVDLGFGVERGNTLMLQLAVFSNLQRDRGPPKLLDPAPVAPPSGARPASSRNFVEDLQALGKQQGLAIEAVDVRPDQHTLQVWYGESPYRNQAKSIGRLARVLTFTAPPEIKSFTLTPENGGIDTVDATLMRGDVERALRFDGSPEEVWQHATFASPARNPRAAAFTGLLEYPRLSYGMAPALRQHVGGPDSFYLYQLWWRVSGRLALTRKLSLSAAAGFDIHNNFDELRLRSDSRLPHVRSDIASYLKEGENNLVRLEANYLWSPFQDWHARVSAGIFEEMYGGIGGEILYRRYGNRWAVGLNANRVRQRTFDQRLDFSEYEVSTGHLTLYYQAPWYNTLLRLSGGRYLAGDTGATMDISRGFANGVRAGIFATVTDVSAADFGEGSFDKGFYFGLPLDLFFPKSTRRSASLAFRPLTRDGGQKVRDGQELYPLLEGTDPGALARDWSKFMD